VVLIVELHLIWCLDICRMKLCKFHHSLCYLYLILSRSFKWSKHISKSLINKHRQFSFYQPGIPVILRSICWSLSRRDLLLISRFVSPADNIVISLRTTCGISLTIIRRNNKGPKLMRLKLFQILWS
jgi:hypothetical protein